jgi:predicted amidohydrolase YtcJ
MSTDTQFVETTLADANAVGIALDNPDDPHVAVAVHGGRIVYIGISDPMMNSDQQELRDVINACILSAFAMWGAQRSGVVEF